MSLKIRIKNFSSQLLYLHECNVKWLAQNYFVPFSAKKVRFLQIGLIFHIYNSY